MNSFEGLNVESFFGLDIAFVIDSTGSMMSYISGAKESIREIMTQSKIRFKRFNADESLLKFGVVAYRDHPPQETSFLTKHKDFSNFQEASDFLNNLTASGGGDPPEAVLDGLNDALVNLKWREMSVKILFLLLDNPAHGIRFGTNYDCPCGLNESQILEEMKKKQISFHIVRPKEKNEKLDKMIEIFQQYIEIETMELEKHKRISVNEERIMDEDLEMKIFNRSRIKGGVNSKRNSKHMDEEPISPRGSVSSSKSPSYRKKSLKEGLRSRSRSRSPRKEMDIDFADKLHDTSKIDKKYGFRHHVPPKELVSYDVEMNIESGVKDHISKVVIEKLNQYLKI